MSRADRPPRPAATQRSAFEIAGASVLPGRRARLELEVARLPTGNWVTLPLEVLHGTRPGPTLWLSAAVHGDELNGVPIIRRVLRQLRPRQLGGTVLAVPIVNVFGVLSESRYLPDRRDLNRSFPGSPRGSMASRLADLFLREVVARADVGIDLHTGSKHRENLPQIRANLMHPATRELAFAFGAPVVLHADERKGSLREAGGAAGKSVLLYEAGEALRFSSVAIDAGVAGVLRVLAHLGILRPKKGAAAVEQVAPSRELSGAAWARAGRSGFLEVTASLGDEVRAGQQVATVTNAFGDESVAVRSRVAGIVIGVSRAAIVHRGEAVANVASETERA